MSSKSMKTKSLETQLENREEAILARPLDNRLRNVNF